MSAPHRSGGPFLLAKLPPLCYGHGKISPQWAESYAYAIMSHACVIKMHAYAFVGVAHTLLIAVGFGMRRLE